MRFTSWAEYDRAFEGFETSLASVPHGLESVRLADIPFPPAADPAGLAEAGVSRSTTEEGESLRKRLLRRALLRWHPDKWAAVVAKVRAEDKAALAERLGAITQALLKAKDRN
jgi:hypothetical protein